MFDARAARPLAGAAVLAASAALTGGGASPAEDTAAAGREMQASPALTLPQREFPRSNSATAVDERAPRRGAAYVMPADPLDPRYDSPRVNEALSAAEQAMLKNISARVQVLADVFRGGHVAEGVSFTRTNGVRSLERQYPPTYTLECRIGSDYEAVIAKTSGPIIDLFGRNVDLETVGISLRRSDGEMVRVLQQRGYGMTLFPEVNVGGVLSAVESAVEREYLAFATSSRVAELLPDALISARGRLANAPIIGDVLRGAVAKVALPGIGRVDLLTQGHESESFDVEREDLRRALLILSSRELPAFKAPVDLAGGPATLVYDPEGATESLTIRYRGPGKSAVAMEWHEGSAPRAIDVGGWAIYQTTPAGLEVIDPKVVRAVMLSLTEAVRKIAQ